MFFQDLIKTYDTYDKMGRIGEKYDKDPLIPPIMHILKEQKKEQTIVIVQLLKDGTFLKMIDSTELTDRNMEMIIPVTEKSASRTTNTAPHPLCDTVEQILTNEYLAQLKNWAMSEYSHPIVNAVYDYMQRKRFSSDLDIYVTKKIEEKGKSKRNLSKEKLEKEIKQEKKKSEKYFVLWEVKDPEYEASGKGRCWENISLRESFIKWNISVAENDPTRKRGLCMITGDRNVILAGKHPSVASIGQTTSKLISSNDVYTYRGILTDKDPFAVFSMGYIASQKAHIALNYLIKSQKVYLHYSHDCRCIVWTPNGKQTEMVPHIEDPLFDDFSEEEKKLTLTTPGEYANRLNKLIEEYKGTEKANWINDTISIAEIKATSKGRAALTFYATMNMADYFERLKKWDETCCWWSWNKKYVTSPFLKKIVLCAYGNEQEKQNGKTELKVDDATMNAQMHRLTLCKLYGLKMPKDIMRRLVENASHPERYTNQYQTVLTTTCAIIKKYYNDHKGVCVSMEVEENVKSRDYLFGQLLAILDKMETSTYKKDDKREPFAMRLLQRYRKQPLNTYELIYAHVRKAYYPKLRIGSQVFYSKKIQGIMTELNTICSEEKDWNKPLNEMYLVGYHLQLKELYQKEEAEKAADTTDSGDSTDDVEATMKTACADNQDFM